MARWRASKLSFLGFPLLVLLHLFVAPYTKVEESFNIQAAHDILQYGVPLGGNAYLRFKALYDHMTFPGAVPRTFIGAMTLATFAKPIMWLCDIGDGKYQQITVRGLLGLFNAAALLQYANGVRRAYGDSAAVWYTVLQASQFHIWYYASRTLPNMFAFGISTFALSLLLPVPSTTESRVKRTRLALYLLTLATIVFRAELALLLGSQCLYMLLRTSSNLASAISLVRRVFVPAILTATVAGLLLTVSIDTYFWQSRKLLWPELAAFLSNVFPKNSSQGSSAWGTSPWHWYFTSALPRLINPSHLLLIPWTFTLPGIGTSSIDLVAPSLGYTVLYSFLAHKETRFLFPILPPLTAAVARAADYIYQRRDRYILCRLVTIWLILSTIITTILSHAVLPILSAQTYPGAHALSSLHTLSLNYPPQPTIRVHLTNLALQTGVTRFLSTPTSTNSNFSLKGHDRPTLYLPGSRDGTVPALSTKTRTKWLYDKSDNETDFLTPTFWAQFDYVVVEDPGRVIGAWDIVDKIAALGSPRALRPDVGRGLLVLGGKEARREDDGLGRLAEAMYGEWAKKAYGIVHDIVREGYGLDRFLGKRVSLSFGWWVHAGLETKLYILKRAQSGIMP
ncbi:alpha-1,6- mannosyltransferase [Cladophialophora chaetospira]|uniref:Mannosyltransferase n=1 Tax=Cladophialophora chaetospira TaxID=386627 RepID=A0AA38XLN2_9EURO|nr:alpha-1,6- mannosyltransferase [Cladophialophora chaetospira]